MKADEFPPGTTPFDINGIDWLAQQNGNQFDPQLFGDYREPIDNILSSDMFTNDNYFSDAFSMPNFSSPSNIAPSPAPKKDLLQQIDEKQTEDDAPLPEKKAKEEDKMLKANTIWWVPLVLPSLQITFLWNDCLQLHLGIVYKRVPRSQTGPSISTRYAMTSRRKLNARRLDGYWSQSFKM